MVIFGGVPSDQPQQPTGKEGWLTVEFRRGTQPLHWGRVTNGVCIIHVYFLLLSAPKGHVKTDTGEGSAMETIPIAKNCA